jgi:hypothetical protein
MKKQCNLCGLREDISELIPQNKTWCLVFGEEVDNKFTGCEHWHPDSSSIRNQKHQIAAEIKRDLKDKMEPEWNDVEILLEPVQQELLITIVESARNTPIDSRQKVFVVSPWVVTP